MFPCEVKEFETRPTLSIRFRSPVQDLSQHFGRVYGSIIQYLGELGEQPVGAAFGAYYNMDMQNLDVELGFPVSKELPGKEGIKASHIPGGKFAVVLHTGPYDKVGPAYEALTKWIAENGYEPTGVVYEFYLNDPMQTKPEDLKTQVMFPLK